MSFSEVTNESWFSRIGGAFKGILAGGLMAIVAFPLLFWNEGRAVHRAKTLAEGRGAVIENVSIDSVDANNNGKLVHMTGTAKSDATLSDEKFNVSVDNAIKLIRTVEMYQWKEKKTTEKRKKLGGGVERITNYSYDQVWSNSRIDSDQFHERYDKRPNPKMRFKGDTQTADIVNFGAFKLASGQISKLGNAQPVELKERGPQNVDDVSLELNPTPDPKAFKIHNNQYYLGQDPASPRIGDTRVGFKFVGPSEISLIYQQAGDSFTPYESKNGSLALLDAGKQTADQMFTAAETANKMMLWIIRLVGFLLMAIGFGLILRPLAVLGDVVPFVGGLVGFATGLIAVLVAGGLSLVTIAIAWLFYRPVFAIVLIAAAVGLFILARKFFRKDKVLDVDAPVVVG